MRRALGCLGGLACGGAYALALAAVAAHAFGLVATDSISRVQWIWWVPWLGYAALCLPAMACGVFDRNRRRRWPRRLAMAAGPLVAGAGLLRDVGFRPMPEATPETVRLVQWNASWPDQQDGAEPAARLMSCDADVFVISNPWQLFLARRQEWKEAGYEVVIPGVFAIASRFPVLEARPVAAPSGVSMAFFRLDTRARWGRTCDLLAVDFPSDPRARRIEIARSVREAVARAGLSAPDLVLGDFNITRGSAALAEAFPGYREAFSRAGRGWGASFEEPRPLFHIDLLLYGPAVEPVACRLWPVAGRHRGQETWIVPASPRAD